MREIKFRAWEPLNKKMHYMDWCLYEVNGDIKSFALPPCHQSLHKDYAAMNLDVICKMQFSGIRDKNEKEIYDKDICEDSYINPLTQQIVTLRWVVQQEPGIWWLRKINEHNDTPLFMRSNRIEVIGNVYENPELAGEQP
jgi:uncharacterized phage protein (TIGR01671 family)